MRSNTHCYEIGVIACPGYVPAASRLNVQIVQPFFNIYAKHTRKYRRTVQPNQYEPVQACFWTYSQCGHVGNINAHYVVLVIVVGLTASFSVKVMLAVAPSSL